MKHFFKEQPKGLYWLIFTELWERFGFYMVQTILILYMSQGLKYTDQGAYVLYGAFSSMLFLTPVLGGYLSDRYMGFRQSIILGAILFIVGYSVMAIPDERALFLGLGIVIIANGFFKPNVSSIVGDLYHGDDPRRDGGFTLFYMGINVGSLIPPIFAGALVAAYSWGAGFLVAALGMVVALITFLASKHSLKELGKVPEHSPFHRGPFYRRWFYFVLGAGCVVALAVLELLFRYPTGANFVLILASAVILVGVFIAIFKEPPAERHRMFACLVLILISVGFWAIYNQTYTSLMLFAERNMSKELLGFPIDAEFTQFFNPIFILLLGPILSTLWIRMGEKNPSTPLKFSFGVLSMAIGFLVLGLGTRWFSPNGETSPWWLVSSYFIQTIGELLLSPIGLAMVTRLAPHRLVGRMMGVWFLTQSAAFAIGAELATLSDVPKGISQILSLPIYSHAFFFYGWMSLVLAILSFALSPYLQKLIHPRPT